MKARKQGNGRLSAGDFTPRYLPIAWKIVAVVAILTLLGIGTLSVVVLNQVTNVLNNQVRAQAELTLAPIARTSAELMLAEDHLTLETLLNSLVEDGRVESVTAYAIDRGAIASAGTRPRQPGASVKGSGHWRLRLSPTGARCAFRMSRSATSRLISTRPRCRS